MRKKLPVLDRTRSIEVQNNNPGAGRYENPEAMSPSGRYSVSKHKGTGASLFNPKRSTRFFEFSISFFTKKIQTPGLEIMKRSADSATRGITQYPGSKATGRDCLTRTRGRTSSTSGRGRTETQVLVPTVPPRISGTTTATSMERLEPFPTWGRPVRFQGHRECQAKTNYDVNNSYIFTRDSTKFAQKINHY